MACFVVLLIIDTISIVVDEQIMETADVKTRVTRNRSSLGM